MEGTHMKRDYMAPKVTHLGSLNDLTLGGACGGDLDADFATGTPFEELTCS